MYAGAVIPVRNRPVLVVDAITSIQRQTRPVDDIVVVDDGSTDATPEIVTRLAHHDSRIRLFILEKNIGASAARNFGINVSHSDYICFLDSDDQWLPDKIELQFRLLKSVPGAVASFTGIRYQWGDTKRDVSPPVDVTLEKLRKNNCLGSTSTAIVWREALLQVGGFDPDLPSCQDWDLWIKLRRVGKFSIVPQPLVIFNQSAGNRISKNRTGVLDGHARMFTRALEGVSNRKERRVIAAFHQLRLTQIYYWDFEDLAGATIAVIKSMMLHPTRQGASFLLAIFRKFISKLFGRSCR